MLKRAAAEAGTLQHEVQRPALEWKVRVSYSPSPIPLLEKSCAIRPGEHDADSNVSWSEGGARAGEIIIAMIPSYQEARQMPSNRDGLPEAVEK